MKGSLIAVSLLLGASLIAHAAPAKLNILVILADDLGWSDLGCYGGEIHTPHLDALAANGIRFTQFYNGARCCPSRASLLTGLYPHQTGVGLMTSDKGAHFPGAGDQGESAPGYRGRLNESCHTLGEILRGDGYRTFACGKWHVGDFDPTTRGFDAFYGFYAGYGIDSWEQRMLAQLPASWPKHEHKYSTFYATDAITDHAIDFLHDSRDLGKAQEQQGQSPKPWFLYLAYQAPHFPLQAPAEEIKPYESVYAQGWDKIREARLQRLQKMGLVSGQTTLTPRSMIPKPGIAKSHGSMTADGNNPAWDSLPAPRQADLARRMATYAAMVTHLDACVGRLVDDLRKAGELDNTLLFFLSDNGACAEWDPFGFDLTPLDPSKTTLGVGVNLGTQAGPNVLHEGEALEKMGGPDTFMSYGSGWANACNTPWRLYKHYGHEGGISTPLIVHWPASIRTPGQTRSQPGHLIDIMATCIDITGAAYPSTHEGHNVPSYEGHSLVRTWIENSPIPRDALYWEHEGNAAVRVGDLKLVRLGRKGTWELYDMSKDRTELNNLAAQMPDKVREMSELWDQWAVRTHVVPYPGEGMLKKARTESQ